MKALVTGGAGYFGTLLLRKLIRSGWECRSLDLWRSDEHPDSVEQVQADIRDRGAVRSAVRGVDAVFHCVAMVPLARDRAAFDSVNTGGTRVLLEACQHAAVGKVIYLSSSAVYGVPAELPVTENTPLHPAEPYGRSKQEAEKACREFAARGLDVTIVRPRTILGHGRLGIFQALFDWIARGRRIPVLAGYQTHYQFLHADDLADACVRAAELPGPDVFNCWASRHGSIRSALETLCDHAGTGARVSRLPRVPVSVALAALNHTGMLPLAPYHALMYGRAMYFDTRHAQSRLGWEPRYSNEDMFIESYDWFIANRGLIGSGPNRSPHQSAVNSRLLDVCSRLLSTF